jgi:hypothetical protein
MDVAFPWDPLHYPFDVPAHSFLWSTGRAETDSTVGPVDQLTVGRHPVLAIGSNASPAQLTRKFSDERFADPASPDGCIPVLRATVNDVDVVYGAHLAWYGSLPATLLDTPGARAHVFVTWLTSLQMERMNETEGIGHAYQLRPMLGVRCHGEAVERAVSYVTINGVAILAGSPLGLASIDTPGSRWPRGSQREAWDALAADMGCGQDGKALLERVLDSSDWRERVYSHLASHRLAEPQTPNLPQSQ